MWIAVGCALLSLAGSARAQQEKKGAPTEVAQAEVVKAALAELRTALARGKSEERIAALEKAAGTRDASVVEPIAKALGDGDPAVQGAAIEALRGLQRKEALATLVGAFERDKKLAKDAELSARLVKAIGSYGDAAAVEKLAAAGIDGERAVVEARILSIANVRSTRSVELLVELARGTADEKVGAHAETIRLALARLVGEDLGTARQRWLGFWSERKKTLEIAVAPPLLPRDMQRRWDMFWGNPSDPGRAKPRGERGNDPEGKGS
ncbi:MAG: HEAT repeat domain-containing protein [Planctomycetes bacterium]|nr:HEAT repeat domain-containing protein [Planctomycetota bacterium]